MTTTGRYTVLFAKISAGVFILILLSGLVVEPAVLLSVTLAYLLSFFFVGSSLLVMYKIDLEDQGRFNRIFFISLILRFALVLTALVLALKTLKFHQIYFTVSFIISYIFHSVIENIFINKILETDT